MTEPSRFRLREFRESDLDAMQEVMGDARVMRFSLNGPYTRSKTREFLAACAEGYRKRGTGLYAVEYRDGERVIGYCGFYFPRIDAIEEVEIGYRLHPDFWGRGLATEAACAVREHGATKLGFRRMISCIEAENVASIRVAEKLGMRHQKDALYADRIPVRIYALSR